MCFIERWSGQQDCSSANLCLNVFCLVAELLTAEVLDFLQKRTTSAPVSRLTGVIAAVSFSISAASATISALPLWNHIPCSISLALSLGLSLLPFRDNGTQFHWTEEISSLRMIVVMMMMIAVVVVSKVHKSSSSSTVD